MEFCHSYLFVTFVVMTVDQIVGRDDGPYYKFSAISISPAKTNLFSPWTLRLYTQSFLIAKAFKHFNTFSINALSKNLARKRSSALPN